MPILNWLTRDEDIRTAARVPYRLLEEDSSLSAGDDGAGNMLIQGDNLEALKALLPFYAGRVKCIYIDPPYNTRSAFEHYDDNLEHTQWLAPQVRQQIEISSWMRWGWPRHFNGLGCERRWFCECFVVARQAYYSY